MTLQNYSGRLFFANRVSLSCTVSANWRPKRQKSVVDLHSLCCTVSVRWRLPCPKTFTSQGLDFTSPRVYKTSPGVVITSPGLVFTSPGVMRARPGAGFISRRLGKTNRRLVRAISLPKPKKSMLPFHTRAFIRIPSSGKSTHAFTRKMFLPDYHRIQCEGLRFQVFTRAAKRL